MVGRVGEEPKSHLTMGIAQALLQSVKDGQTGRELASTAFDVAVVRQLHDYARMNGRDPKDGSPMMPTDAVEAIRLGYEALAGEAVTPPSQSSFTSVHRGGLLSTYDGISRE